MATKAQKAAQRTDSKVNTGKPPSNAPAPKSVAPPSPTETKELLADPRPAAASADSPSSETTTQAVVDKSDQPKAPEKPIGLSSEDKKEAKKEAEDN